MRLPLLLAIVVLLGIGVLAAPKLPPPEPTLPPSLGPHRVLYDDGGLQYWSADPIVTSLKADRVLAGSVEAPSLSNAGGTLNGSAVSLSPALSGQPSAISLSSGSVSDPSLETGPVSIYAGGHSAGGYGGTVSMSGGASVNGPTVHYGAALVLGGASGSGDGEAQLSASRLAVNGRYGVTVSGSNCAIRRIERGLIVDATCTP